MMQCPRCHHAFDGRPGLFCSQCGTRIQMQPIVRHPRRRRSILRLPLLLLVIGAILCAFVRIDWTGNLFQHPAPSLNAVIPHASQFAAPKAVAIRSTPLAGIDDVWIEGNTVDVRGIAGLLIHARVHGTTPVVFGAHFREPGGEYVGSADPDYSDPDDRAATSVPCDLHGGLEDVMAFLPRGALRLTPGEHYLQVLPTLYDSEGQVLATAAPVSITARRAPCFITKVAIRRIGSGSQGTVAVVASFVLSGQPTGSPERVVATFENAAGGSLMGTSPYVDRSGSLSSYRPFIATSSGEYACHDFMVTIPARLIPPGARASVHIEDASGNHITDPVRIAL